MCKTRGRRSKGYREQVTCNTCIEETPVETNSWTCSHLTLDKSPSNKMRENKNDIRAVIGKTVTTKKKESGARGRNGENKWLERYLIKVTGWIIYQKDKFECRVIRKR